MVLNIVLVDYHQGIKRQTSDLFALVILKRKKLGRKKGSAGALYFAL